MKTLIDRQFWFMLREAKFDKYSFKIKNNLIEYKVNYTSVDTVYEFDANLSKFSWKPQITANRKY